MSAVKDGYPQRERRFRQLYEEHYRSIQAYAVRRVYTPADVADVVAEVSPPPGVDSTTYPRLQRTGHGSTEQHGAFLGMDWQGAGVMALLQTAIVNRVGDLP